MSNPITQEARDALDEFDAAQAALTELRSTRGLADVTPLALTDDDVEGRAVVERAERAGARLDAAWVALRPL